MDGRGSSYALRGLRQDRTYLCGVDASDAPLAHSDAALAAAGQRAGAPVPEGPPVAVDVAARLDLRYGRARKTVHAGLESENEKIRMRCGNANGRFRIPE